MRRFSAVRRARAARMEPWQVIYTDLMTIVMVFFVILWTLTQARDEGVSETLGDQTVKMVNLPGDVLFATGKSQMTPEGEEVFRQLFAEDPDVVLSFDAGELVKRLLVIHGHTDRDGKKDDNFALGYRRAYAAYQEILQYNEELADHAVICTHADNTPAQPVPEIEGELTAEQRAAVREAMAKNRRITIEDKVVNRYADTP